MIYNTKLDTLEARVMALRDAIINISKVHEPATNEKKGMVRCGSVHLGT